MFKQLTKINRSLSLCQRFSYHTCTILHSQPHLSSHEVYPHDSAQGSVVTGTAHTTTPPSYNPDVQSQVDIYDDRFTTDVMDAYGQPRRPTPMQMIAKVPVIYVNDTIAICDGGPGGHPREFIQLNKANGQPEGCKYCGLRYAMSHDDHKEHSAQVDATGSNTY